MALGEPTLMRSGVTVTVSLTNVPAGNYILQRSATLAAGSWLDLFTQAPVGDTLTYIDPDSPNPRGFYRITSAP